MPGRIASFFRNLLRKGAVEQALDDELQSAVELLTQEKMKQGLSHPDARRQAVIELGGVEQVKEEVRAIRPGMFLETFALPGINQFNWPLCPEDYFTFREQSRTFQDIGLYYMGFGASLYSANVTGLGRPEHVPALGVTDEVLPILGVTPLLGRSFTRTDDEPGSSDTVLITSGYWRSKFGGDRSVIGKTIDLDGKPSTIIGVLPQRFRFLDMTNLGMLLPLRPRLLRGYNYFAVARLKLGVTLAE